MTRLDVAADPVLTVRGLAKSFVLHGIGGRVVRAFSDVNLDVYPGRLTALAGSSGAGKSSILKCIYRTYLPSAGRVVLTTRDGETVDLVGLGDREMADLRQREIGYVSQFLRAEPRRGCLDVVVRAGVRRGLTVAHAHQAAETVLTRLNVGADLWGTYPTLLSGGEQQRVNFAAATLAPPRVLLLDEPVSALDPINRAAAMGVVDDLVAQGVGVLAVFHDLEAMRRHASEVVVLRGGAVIAAGPPGEVLGLTDGEVVPA